MAIIEKKVWPEFFEKIATGEKNVELRLADFPLAAGDTLLLKEFDPKAKAFSGREISKGCKRVARFNPLEAYKASDLKKHGCYLIEFE